MTVKTNRRRGARPTWFVGASYGGTDDQTERFVADSLWKNGYKNKYHDVVRTDRAMNEAEIVKRLDGGAEVERPALRIAAVERLGRR